MKTIVSGARPTGSLHLGNYAGAIANWLRLQETEHCYFFVADYHMLTTGFLDVSQLHENTGIVLAELHGCRAAVRRAHPLQLGRCPAHAAQRMPKGVEQVLQGCLAAA